jgi:hypothetical protein
MMRASFAQHVEARDLANQAFIETLNRDPNLTERQYLQAVACLETTYGAGWRGASVAGKGSNNMGAIQGGRPPCNPETEFETSDTHADGTVYRWCYKKYPTPLDGWKDLVKVLYVNRPSVLGAASSGNIDAAVREQRITGYFEAPLDRYTKGVWSCITELANSLGEPIPPKVGVSLG